MIKVLIVDPDPCELYRTCEIVAGLGIEDMLCASTFEDALCCLQEGPSLVIAEADQIPKSKENPEPVSGNALIQAIKVQARGAIIIGQMANVRGERMFSALRSGADDVVDKGVLPSRLLDKIPIWVSVAEKSHAVDKLVRCHG